MGQQFKVGDRVVVAEPAEGSCGGYYFRAGNTGTVIDSAEGLVHFDAQRGVCPRLDRHWLVNPRDLRPLTLPRAIVAWSQRLRFAAPSLSTNEGGR